MTAFMNGMYGFITVYLCSSPVNVPDLEFDTIVQNNHVFLRF